MSHRTALITGPTSGIGRAFAGIMAARGHALVLVGRDREKLQRLQAELAARHPVKTDWIAADLALSGAARTVYDTCRARGHVVDTLINNAGVGRVGEAVDGDPRLAAAELQLNIITLTELAMLFGREMRERRMGRILNVASTAAFQPVPRMAVYAAGKSYVLHFSEALAKELEDHGVTVTCLCPGMTDTAWFAKAGVPESDKGFFARSKRVSPATVAAFGLAMMERGRMTAIHGAGNRFMAFMNRLVPRSMVARISKNMLYHRD